MTQRILTIGLQPDAVDYSDPDLPPGLDAGKIRDGLALAQRLAAERGMVMDNCLLGASDDVEATIAAALSGQHYACVVIGGGIRLPRATLRLFEQVVNAVHRHAPATTGIAFNTSPPDSVDAAIRWMPAAE